MFVRDYLRRNIKLQLRCLATLALCIAISASALAQQNGAGDSGSGVAIVESGLTVASNPPGALVKLNGASTLVGLAPVFFGQGLPGFYNLEVSSPGFETYRSTVTVTNTTVTDVQVNLKRRTRGKAALRSLLWPGWGQLYSEQPTKGAVMSGLAIIAGVSLAVAETNYQDKREVYDLAYGDLLDAQVAGSLDDLAPLQLRVNDAQAEAYDAESYRRAAIGATIAVWSVSFLDALLFFPEAKSSAATRALTLNPEIDPLAGKSGLSLSLRF